MTMTLNGSGTGTVGVPNSATAQNATGTSIDFTGIPAGTKRITVMFNNVSTNGTSPPQVQIGSGSVVTTGYVAYSVVTGAAGTTGSAYTSGIGLCPSGQWGAAGVVYGALFLCLEDSATNTWVASATLGGRNATATIGFITSGYLALSGSLDRVRITTVTGADSFDSGSINILYE